MCKGRVVMTLSLINWSAWKLSVIKIEGCVSNQLYNFGVCIQYLHAEWFWDENWRLLILCWMTAMYFHKCMSILTWNCYFSSEVIIAQCESRPWEGIIIIIFLFEIMAIISIISQASYKQAEPGLSAIWQDHCWVGRVQTN